jgi:hypothetical protein
MSPAQSVRYEFFELKPPPGVAASSGLGINNIDKTVVGWTGPSALGGTRRAALWRFCEPIGGPAFVPYATPIDLALAAGIPLGSTLNSEARELNNAEIAVGYREVLVDGRTLRRGMVWDVPDAISAQIGSFTNAALDSSEAWSVSDDAIPVVVGFAQDNLLTCSGLGNDPFFKGFRSTWQNALSPLVALDGATGRISYAHDVSTGTPTRAVGYENDCEANDPCGSARNALEWTGASTPTRIELDEFGPEDGSVVWATNDAGMSVGSVNADPACVTQAAFWAADGSLTNLHVASGMAAESSSTAFGVSEVLDDGRVLAVGQDFGQIRGVLWIGTPVGSSIAWQHQYLDDLVSQVWEGEIAVAFDVTDDGWIAADALVGGLSRGVALRPVVPGLFCPGDIDRDLDVDASDLALLLGAWGTGPTSSYLADANIDDVVNAFDLAILLGAWGGTCSGCSSGLSGAQSGSSEPDANDQVTAPLATACQLLGFATIGDFVQWAVLQPPEDLEPVGLWLSALLETGAGHEN